VTRSTTAARAATFLQAAVAVLERTEGTMTSREITEQAMRRRLLATAGRTPWKTMDAAQYASNLSGGPIERLARQGPTRAVRGTVCWRLRRI
jgi:hypothetical protein